MRRSSDSLERRLWLRAGMVWLALTALLTATVIFAYMPLGPWKPAVGLAIAAAKALLVALIYMELSKAGILSRLAAVSGLLFLGVLFTLTFADEATRRHVLSLFGPW